MTELQRTWSRVEESGASGLGKWRDPSFEYKVHFALDIAVRSFNPRSILLILAKETMQSLYVVVIAILVGSLYLILTKGCREKGLPPGIAYHLPGTICIS